MATDSLPPRFPERSLTEFLAGADHVDRLISTIRAVGRIDWSEFDPAAIAVDVAIGDLRARLSPADLAFATPIDLADALADRAWDDLWATLLRLGNEVLPPLLDFALAQRQAGHEEAIAAAVGVPVAEIRRDDADG